MPLTVTQENVVTNLVDNSWLGETFDAEYVQHVAYVPETDNILFSAKIKDIDPNVFSHSSSVYMKNMDTGVVTPISTDVNGDYFAGGDYINDANTQKASGKYLWNDDQTKFVFNSSQTLDTADIDGNKMDVYVKDLTTGDVSLVSDNLVFTYENNGSTISETVDLWSIEGEPYFSPDGESVIFGMHDAGLNIDPIVMHELDTGNRTFVNRITIGGNEAFFELGTEHRMAPNGTQMVFTHFLSRDSVDGNGVDDIYFYDWGTETFDLVSQNAAGVVGNAKSWGPYVTISDDSNEVYFRSNASNFLYNSSTSAYDRDTNNRMDLFMKDMTTGEIIRINEDEFGVSTYAAPGAFALSADESQVAFIVDDHGGGFGGTVYVKDMDTGELTRYVTDWGAHSDIIAYAHFNSISFSDDGTQIMFLATVDLDTVNDTNGVLNAYTFSLYNNINGTAGCETLDGTADVDVIHGNGHSDLINGLGEADYLYGDEGHDTLNGGDGNDSLWGGVGHDELNGDAGDDVLRGMEGHDSIYGGAGNDTIYTGTEGQSDTVYGGAGDDMIYVASMGDDQIHFDGGADTLVIGGANVEVTVYDFTDGTDLIDLTVFGAGLSMSNVSFYNDDLDGWTVKVLDGANRADIHLDGLDLGTTPLTAADFIF